MTQNTLSAIESYAAEYEGHECDLRTRTPRPNRKNRGYKSRHTRRVRLGIKGRNAGRSVENAMKRSAIRMS